jgi:hypothetical protein
MSKIDIETVYCSMASAGIPQKEIEAVMDDLKKQLEDLAADKQKKEKVEKYKYIIYRDDVPQGTTTDELPMVIVEAEESVMPNDVISEIKRVALAANNDVKKLKKSPVKSVFDAIERVPPKNFKEAKIRVIAKTLVQALPTDNKLS